MVPARPSIFGVPCSAFLRFPESVSRKGCAGFTLLEALIALTIVTVTVTVLTRAHMQTLRAEAFAGRLDGARLQAESLVAGTLLGDDPRSLTEAAGVAGWDARWDVVGGGPGMPAWQMWKVSASNEAAPAVVVYLKPRG
jgi:Tfp pilus assembly protein PilV